MPPVVLLPFHVRPLLPGVYQPLEVTNSALATALTEAKGSSHPYVGVFLPKPDTLANNKGVEPHEPLKITDLGQVHDIGTIAQIYRLEKTPRGVTLMLLGGKRVRLGHAVQTQPVMLVKVEEAKNVWDDESEGPSLRKAYQMEVVQTLKEILKLNPFFKEQMQMMVERSDFSEPDQMADFGAALTTADAESLQEVLSTLNVTERIERTLLLLKRELELSKLQSEISRSVDEKISANQRRFILMEQLKQIKKELGLEKDDKEALVSKFRERIEGKKVSEEASRVFESEIAKLQSLEPVSPEFNLTRNYLDWLSALPWGVYSEENFSLARAEEVLEQDHYGLEDVKERILEFIAVSSLCGSTQGKIICFVGPPGVGKTSIGKSIATALGREFYRFSVGGLSDVSEIKGHRRTYIGAMPGKLIQCLKAAETSNPVVLIDEIDKLGRGFQGDPASALLEVLDPSQNGTFMDHYLDVPVDLSKVLFLCTANVTETIPGPLLDRMEVVRLSGYILEEKKEIARRYLEPAARKQMGLKPEHLELRDDAIVSLIRWYCREAGVRNLQKHIERICRKVAHRVVKAEQLAEAEAAEVVELNEADDQGVEAFTEGAEAGAKGDSAAASSAHASNFETAIVGEGQLHDYVGKPKFQDEKIYQHEPGNEFLETTPLHLHVPEGATPKDGPSAGITMVTSLISLATGKPTRADVAMTGELSLTGRVLPIGGVREKTIAARRAGMKHLIFPKANERDFTELPEHLRDGISAYFASDYDDVYRVAFDASGGSRAGTR